MLFAIAANHSLAEPNYATAYSFSTFAGESSIGSANGAGSAARFYRPQGIAVDPADHLFGADAGNGRVRKISSVGVVSNYAEVRAVDLAIDQTGNLSNTGGGGVEKWNVLALFTLMAFSRRYTTTQSRL